MVEAESHAECLLAVIEATEWRVSATNRQPRIAVLHRQKDLHRGRLPTCLPSPYIDCFAISFETRSNKPRLRHRRPAKGKRDPGFATKNLRQIAQSRQSQDADDVEYVSCNCHFDETFS